MTDTILALASDARIATPKARGYLMQLCKHFAHKTPASFEDNRGRIEFAAGLCELDAGNPETLLVHVSAADDSQLATVENVVERHLRRFAVKEDLTIHWIRSN